MDKELSRSKLENLSLRDLQVVARKLRVKSASQLRPKDLYDQILIQHTEEEISEVIKISWQERYRSRNFVVGSFIVALLSFSYNVFSDIIDFRPFIEASVLTNEQEDPDSSTNVPSVIIPSQPNPQPPAPDPGPQQAEAKTPLFLQGFVTSRRSEALAGVDIRAAKGLSAQTDSLGFFKIELTGAASGDQIQFFFSKEGYQTVSRYLLIPQDVSIFLDPE